MRWTSGSTQPDAAPVEISYNGGIDNSKTVNRTLNNGTWVSMGVYSFSAGTLNYVKLSSADSGYTIADAVKCVKQ